MKVRIEEIPENEELQEEEIIIRCHKADARVMGLQKRLKKEFAAPPALSFFKDGDMKEEFFLNPDEILFFETDGDAIFAHIASDSFRTDKRLYELEGILPSNFVRVSKSALVNIRLIYSIRRNLTGSSPLQFCGSHKQVYVSRFYYKNLRRALG